TARITSRKTRDGSYAFYAHLPIPTAPPATVPIPDRVIGVHEHEDGYSYVLSDFTGAILHSGHVPVPDHVRPEKGQQYSHNYAFEIANQIVALAAFDGAHNALIALEKTNWRKQRVQLSRQANRRQFAQPSAKIRAIVQYKSLLAGLPTIHHTWGVSSLRC